MYVIYWEKSAKEIGFVSYDNTIGQIREEYNPVPFQYASRYEKKSDAEKTMLWYKRRSGFGDFIIMEVQDRV